MAFDKSNIGKNCYINLSQEVSTEDSALGTIIGYYNDNAEEYYFVSIVTDGKVIKVYDSDEVNIIEESSSSITPESVVNATSQMDAQQKTDTKSNLGVIDCNSENIVSATQQMTPIQAAEIVKNLGIPGVVYEGVDITVKFASEIANYTDEWAWIKSRIQAGNYAGINVGDYIPVTANGNNFKARILGINTYTGYGDTGHEVGNHIDWMFEELWLTVRPVNLANYNNGLIPKEDIVTDGIANIFVLTKEMNAVSKIELNGTELSNNWEYYPQTYTIEFDFPPAAGTMTVTGTGTEYPWLASDAYHFANSLAGQVPNGTGLNPAVTHVDYTQGGIYYYLPQKLKDVIIQKRIFLPKRYSATGILNNPNAGGFADIGYIWFPTECEVAGQGVWANTAYDMMGSALQYPYFAGNMNRLKERNGSRANWWLLSQQAGLSTGWCLVGSYGYTTVNSTSYASVSSPVCFRT